MTVYKLATAIFLTLCAEATAQTSFWTNSRYPLPERSYDTKSVTLGLKFYSDVPGTITGVRFYKGSRNTGTHVGTLWSSSGAKLASVTFSRTKRHPAGSRRRFPPLSTLRQTLHMCRVYCSIRILRL